MFAQALFKEITQYAEHLLKKNPLFSEAKNGSITPQQLSEYLHGVNSLVEHTPIHLALALKISREANDELLASYFSHKITEETGHDAWAKSDLSHIQNKHHIAPKLPVLKPMQELISLIEKNIRYNPRLYPSYILLAEQTCVVVAPPWLSDLENHCSIPKEWMSVIGNHGELDKHHVREGIQEIEGLALNPKEQTEALIFVREAMALYDQYCRLCKETYDSISEKHTNVSPAF